MVDLDYIIKLFLSKRKENPSRDIALGFAAVILTGAVLLMLPISARSRESTDFFYALFTATSSTCVTGLTIYDTFSHWSLFGQVVILILIQIGGLGFMTVVTTVFLLGNRQIGMKSRMTMMYSFSLESMEGIVRLVRHVIQATLIMEGIGAIILSCCFVPKFGLGQGIWSGIFHSVSAFCNAGFDLNGSLSPNASMVPFQNHPVVLMTLAALIAIGGLGFYVWEDLYTKRSWRKISLYTKLVLLVTPLLILAGTVGFLVFESDNMQTMGKMTGMDKVFNALFQSVTTRTAGFDSINQAAMTQQSKVLSTVLMMIGGSSGSTAGGIKTITVAIVLLAAYSTLTGRHDTVVFGRRVGHRQIILAMTLMMMSIILNLAGGMVISAVHGLNFLDCIYETASAYATVGLTVGVTGDISNPCRAILMLYMFVGRVGIMTVAVTIMMKNRAADGGIKYPGATILIG